MKVSTGRGDGFGFSGPRAGYPEQAPSRMTIYVAEELAWHFV